jgi:hypothetical protein
MNRFRFALTLTLLATAAVMLPTAADAADTIKRISGPSLNGTIKSIGKSEVTIEKQSGSSDTVPVNDIEAIYFDGEPGPLKSVRSSVASGAYTNALNTLDRIDPASATRSEVQEELQFFRAYCHARKAMLSNDAHGLKDAGTEMVKFVNEHPSSYHGFAANETVVELLLAIKNPEAAQKFYDDLATAPFPEYKMKAGVYKGRALAAQKKYAEAQQAFAGVITLADQHKGPHADTEKFHAAMGQADCLANEGKVDDAIKLVEGAIKNLDPENDPLQAQAFLTLGECYLKKPSDKDALLAFLHVDILYPGQIQARAAALKEEAVLWTKLGKPDRANQANQALADQASGN